MHDSTASEISVLYIDDDAGIRRLVEKAFTRHGFKVSFATNGDDGLKMLKDGHFDVVTVDHYMPGKDGLAVLEEVRALADPPEVIYVTGADESRIAVAALKSGAADYVIKDVDGVFLELLRNAVETAVEQRELKRQKEVAERQMREARDRAVLLLREVNHRVANSLQLVSSLVTMQTTALKDDTARAALTETQGRIAAIGQIHRRLYTSEDVRFVDMGTYLEGLVEELQGALRGNGRAYAIILTAENVPVATDKAVSLGMLVTELVTNAYKYAYPQKGKGEIRIRFEREGADLLSICVEDDGVGWSGSGNGAVSGLGTKIINSMARSLGAPVEFDPKFQGTRVFVRFPAN
jgi:two-component sensor histidine kinase